MTMTTYNQVSVPSFMYGTAWKKEATARLVQLAVESGFTAIDTANQLIHYQEALVGEALQSLAAEGREEGGSISANQVYFSRRSRPSNSLRSLGRSYALRCSSLSPARYNICTPTIWIPMSSTRHFRAEGWVRRIGKCGRRWKRFMKQEKPRRSVSATSPRRN